METLTLEKGAIERHQATTDMSQQGTVAATEGAGYAATGEVDVTAATEPVTAAAGQGTAEALQPRRHGYREDSPPEVIALLYEARSGNSEAYGELYRRHVGRVTRYVAYRLRHRNRDAVEDIVQEAFCNAFAGLSGAHHDVTGWFLAYAARACAAFDWSNRRYVRAAMTIEAEARLAQQREQVAEAPVPARLGRLAFVQALARLSPDQRQAVQLRFLDGLPREMRARHLGRTANAVTLLERRALRNLRVEFLAAATPVSGARQPASADRQAVDRNAMSTETP